jgi:hypothetical protein
MMHPNEQEYSCLERNWLVFIGIQVGILKSPLCKSVNDEDEKTDADCSWSEPQLKLVEL